MRIGGMYTIDFTRVSKIPKFNVSVKTGDSKRTISLILLENNKIINLNDYTVTVAAKKSDGNDIFNDVSIVDAENGICEVEVTKQMSALDTDLPCEIVLYGADGTVASSSNFVISKISSVRNEESIVSSSEFTALSKALTEVKNIDNRFKEVDSQIKDKANKTTTDNLQTQVNNLVLSAVGDGNNPEIVQSRGSYSLLNERLNNDFVNLWNASSITWEDGFYLNTSGVTVSLAGFSVSSFILVKDYKVIKLLNYTNNNQMSSVSFYNFDGKIISNKIINDGNNIINIDIPFGCYKLKVCKNNTSNPSLYFKTIVNNEMVEVCDMSKMNLGYIDSDGSFKGELEDFIYSDYMKVAKGIEIKNIKENKSYPNIAFYDDDLNFISSINSLSYYLLSDYPSDAKYFIVATRKINPLSIRVPVNCFLETKKLNSQPINVPELIDVVANRENNIYLDNLNMSSNSSYITDFEYKLVDNAIQFTPLSVSNLNLNLQERDINCKVVSEKSTVIRAVSNSFVNDTYKNILIIGDSLIDNSYTAKETYRLLTASGVKFNQLGTRGVEGGKHEGRGGWSWSDYYKSEYDGKVNAFYDNGNLNFKKYCTDNGYSGIDYCIIALGTNDVGQGGTNSVFFTQKNIDTIISRAKGFIDCLVRDYPNCKIAIGLPSIGADIEERNANLFRYKMKKLITAYIDTFDNGKYKSNVTTVAHGLFINRREGYPYSNVPVSNRFTNTNVRCYSDFIHSNEGGYYCYSDCFYAKIMSWLQGNL